MESEITKAPQMSTKSAKTTALSVPVSVDFLIVKIPQAGLVNPGSVSASNLPPDTHQDLRTGSKILPKSVECSGNKEKIRCP